VLHRSGRSGEGIYHLVVSNYLQYKNSTSILAKKQEQLGFQDFYQKSQSLKFTDNVVAVGKSVIGYFHQSKIHNTFKTTLSVLN